MGFIVKPFNMVYLLMFAFFVVLTIAITLFLRKKDLNYKRFFLSIFYIVVLIIFFIYKYYISIDPEYYQIAGYGEFNWFNEIPINVCNITLICIPIAMLTMNEALLELCFFMALLGPLPAILMPGNGFNGYSLLLPRMMGYYFTHYCGLMIAPLLITTKIYRPRLKDLPAMYGLLLILWIVIFEADTWMRSSGINKIANFFFCYDPEGNGILMKCYEWIPIPLLYLIPVVILFIILSSLITCMFEFTNKKA